MRLKPISAAFSLALSFLFVVATPSDGGEEEKNFPDPFLIYWLNMRSGAYTLPQKNYIEFWVKPGPDHPGARCFLETGPNSIKKIEKLKRAREACSDPEVSFGIQSQLDWDRRSVKDYIWWSHYHFMVWWNSDTRFGKMRAEYRIPWHDIGSPGRESNNFHHGYIGPENFTMKFLTWGVPSNDDIDDRKWAYRPNWPGP
ncbi:hypothetical protein NKR23_g1750 [Pleurostoma richardsiae]|uniref:Uncharacterized protein n=1 Tax=Pleurostoma richardsiae TaxID=41990 RepID=A0AA38S3H5_9PEZI|nr:hypothetical protein NKR23_g1750 [Pleurostoma richardsiae]